MRCERRGFLLDRGLLGHGRCGGRGLVPLDPSDHDTQFGCAELVTDLPPSTFAFVLRGRRPNSNVLARERERVGPVR